MKQSITPNDLGTLIPALTDQAQRISINTLVMETNKELKLQLLRSRVDLLGADISLSTSKTRFNGDRIWFVCPKCIKRVGVLYIHPTTKSVGCRSCLGLHYRNQRYRGMIEENLKGEHG